MTEINIGINIGSQITKFSSGFIPSNKVKYNDDIWGPGHNWAWCCTFVCWCFQKAGLSQYFYGGGKTAGCQYLYDYHRSKGEGMTNNYKAGDIVFFNWDGGTNTQHVGIVIEDIALVALFALA